MLDSTILGGFRRRSRSLAYRCVLLLIAVFLVGGEGAILAEQAAQEPAPAQSAAPATPPSPKLSGDQLESLVAPIALYPDDLLAQCLVASTYPVEVVQAQQWVEKNSNLKGDALSQAAMKQDWDPSIQALTGIPDALKVLSQDIKWTVDLGNAFLAQQPDVMDAVQRLRAKAKDGGKLETTEQQTVTTKVIEQKQVVVIEQASPDVVYVPSYSPAVIWGAPPYYPYPPLYYPPYYGGYWLGWGVGIAIGIGIAGGWGCGWGNNTININNNNNFNRNEINHNRGEGNRGQGDRGQGNRGQGDRAQAKNGAGNRGQGGRGGGNSTWQHNPSHRGGAPYGDRATASQFGGETRGQRQGRTGGAQASTRDALSRGSAGGGRTGSDRGGAGASPRAGAGGAGGRSGGSSFGGGGSGGDRVGNRSVSRPGNSGTGFSGSGGGNRGASASRSRGSSSFSGGGGRGGGGGGGRRR